MELISLNELVVLLTELCQSYHINYRKKTNSFMISCPFHDGDDTPSFSITTDEDSPYYARGYCFGCKISRSMPSVLERIKHCDHNSAMQFLAGYGVNPYKNSDYKPTQSEDTIEWSSRNLKDYIYDCYNPNKQSDYLTKRGISEEVQKKFLTGYDYQNKRVCFPCWDVDGKFITMTYRSIIDKRYYLEKGIVKPVYLLSSVRNCGIIYVCESQINALTLWTWGYPAIALFGTGAHHQYKYIADNVQRHTIFRLCFDGDEAGEEGDAKFRRNMSKLNETFLFQTIEIPFGKDVNDLTKEEFEDLLPNRSWITI